MAMSQLGRVFNVETSATTSAVRVSLANAAGVGFVLIGATSGNATIEEHNASSSGTTASLAVVTEYFTSASGVWTRRTQAAAATITAVTGGLAYVYVSASSLSDGYKWISISHASGSFVYLIGDLNSQRKPANLTATLGS